jgi:hypothetical protein
MGMGDVLIEYLQYIIDLPIQPKENLNVRILPKWITNPMLNLDTIPILTGCKYAMNCNEGPQCPYLHPRFEYSETNTAQVTNIYHNVNTIVDNTYHSHTDNNYEKHTI